MSATSEVVEVQDLDALRAPWQGLADADPAATVFAAPAFNIAMWRTLGADAQPNWLAAEAGGALVGLLPLAETRRGRGPASFTRVGFLRNAHTLRNLPLGAPDALAPLLARAADRGAMLFLENLPAARATAVGAAAAEAGLSAIPADPGRTLFRIDMPEGWDAYLAARSPNMRSQVRRRLRRARQTKGITIERIVDRATMASAIDDVFELERRAWQGSEAGAAMTDPDRAFHRRLIEELPEDERGELWILRQNGVAMATLRMLRFRTTLYVHTMYFDAALADLSPGMALFAAMLEDSAGRGITCVDCHGDTPFFRRWATASEPHVTLRFFPRRTAGLIVRTAWQVGRSMDRWRGTASTKKASAPDAAEEAGA